MILWEKCNTRASGPELNLQPWKSSARHWPTELQYEGHKHELGHELCTYDVEALSYGKSL